MCGGAPASGAVRDLARGVHARSQALSAPGERALDARDFDHVDAAADDHAGPGANRDIRA
jgi:hypothetical protein